MKVIAAMFTLQLCSFGMSETLLALPQFAAMNGNKCIVCHVNAQGGGLRNFRGWNHHRDVGLFNPWGEAAERRLKSNSMFDGRLIYGADFRFHCGWY